MREGAEGKRRTGYVWLIFALPQTLLDDEQAANPDARPERSWGVRLQYGPNSSPQVQVIPFTVPGRPLKDLPLYGPGREALTLEDFSAKVTAAGGRTYDNAEEYVDDLAGTLWRTMAASVNTLTGRFREVRNPTLLGDVSPASAAEALRASLPGVDPAVIAATAEALEASDETRKAFERDREAAELLTDFSAVWMGHVTEVVSRSLQEAKQRQASLAAGRVNVAALTKQHQEALSDIGRASGNLEHARIARRRIEARVSTLKDSDEFDPVRRLESLTKAVEAQQGEADAKLQQLLSAADACARTGRRLRTTLTELGEDLEEQTAAATAADPTAAPPRTPLSWFDRPRGTLRVADVVVDSGPTLPWQAVPSRSSRSGHHGTPSPQSTQGELSFPLSRLATIRAVSSQPRPRPPS
jgi:hypothetical protein